MKTLPIASYAQNKFIFQFFLEPESLQVLFSLLEIGLSTLLSLTDLSPFFLSTPELPLLFPSSVRFCGSKSPSRGQV
jgi:hypothetical protein